MNSAFTMTCRVKAAIHTTPEKVWTLPTDAAGFIRIHVPGTNRIFTPGISGLEPNRQMTWNDGLKGIFKGTRVFPLRPRENGWTEFIMEEKFEGIYASILFVRFVKSNYSIFIQTLPPFDVLLSYRP